MPNRLTQRQMKRVMKYKTERKRSAVLAFLVFVGRTTTVSSFSRPVGRYRLATPVRETLGRINEFVLRRRRDNRELSTCLRISTTQQEWPDSRDFLVCQVEQMMQDVMYSLRRKDFAQGLETIEEMLKFVKNNSWQGRSQHVEMSKIADRAIKDFADQAFANAIPSRDGRLRVQKGMEAVQLQLSCDSLAVPYNTVFRSVLLNALKATTKLITEEPDQLRSRQNRADTSFRLLQRLVSGVGVRRTGKKLYMLERDFNLVLNAFCNAGRMDMAHKTVALQERTQSAPPLSPVTFSILLKGYGRLGDIENVKMTAAQANTNKLVPDTVMLNSLIDAYVNCDAVDMAQDVFRMLNDSNYNGIPDAAHSALIASAKRPQPNVRTFNTLLKGLAKNGAIDEAMSLSNTIKRAGIWDHITTNTLVNAAVAAKNFTIAESILSDYTLHARPKRGNHPNVEAYSELVDGYAKSGKLDKALEIMQLMQKRGVSATVVTYTSMVGALAREKKTEQAYKFLDYMKGNDVDPQVATYNAFMSGLLSRPHRSGSEPEKEPDDLSEYHYGEYVNESLKLLGRMIASGVRPNGVTVSLLVHALGRCSYPRLSEAKALVSKLEHDGIISADDTRIATAMISTCAIGGDLRGALHAFRKLKEPDTVAVNAFLDACCRCQRPKLAFETFDHFFGENDVARLKPDVITYAVLIGAVARETNPTAVKKALRLYTEMRNKRRIKPDKGVTDCILKLMVQGGSERLNKREVKFMLDVLRDAEQLEWASGQLERRKRAVRAAIESQIREGWKQDDYILRSIASIKEEKDELFQRKGWNKVDSGFRLWGGSLEEAAWLASRDLENEGTDEFLSSKGWNDVDSGFRIF